MIGYAGYVPLRVGIATDLGRSTALDSWQTEIGRAFGPDDSPEDLLSMLINAHTRTLRETTSAIDLAVMTEISRRIAVSPHVDIYGVGGSAMLAEELQGRLYRIGINTYAWSEVHAGLTSAAIQGPGTVAIGISTTGRTEETLQMLEEAGPGRSPDRRHHQQPDLAAGRAGRPQHRHLDLRAVPATRRPVGQARPAPGPGPAVPPGRPGELRPGEREARRLRPRGLDPTGARGVRPCRSTPGESR